MDKAAEYVQEDSRHSWDFLDVHAVMNNRLWPTSPMTALSVVLGRRDWQREDVAVRRHRPLSHLNLLCISGTLTCYVNSNRMHLSHQAATTLE